VLVGGSEFELAETFWNPAGSVVVGARGVEGGETIGDLLDIMKNCGGMFFSRQAEI